MHMTRVLLSLTLAFCFTASGFGQDDAAPTNSKGKKPAARAIKGMTAKMMKHFAAAELSDEQTAKAKKIIAKNVPMIVAARKAKESLLTKEQKKARASAMSTLKKEGIKGAKRWHKAIDAMGLSKEEMAAYRAATKKVENAVSKVRVQVMALLNADQIAAMPVPRTEAKGTSAKTQMVTLNVPNMT